MVVTVEGVGGGVTTRNDHNVWLLLPTYAGERWKPGEQQYDAALQELGRKVCREEERDIQDLVFKLKLLKQAKAEESGNAATKILRRMAPLRRYNTTSIAVVNVHKCTGACLLSAVALALLDFNHSCCPCTCAARLRGICRSTLSGKQSVMVWRNQL